MQRVLVGVDDWQRAETAFERARRIAVTRCATLTVVHVPKVNVSAHTLRLLRDEVEREARARLGEDALRLRLEVGVSEGYSADAILGAAEYPVPDLIVLGDHGKLQMRDRIFGTTATRVIRQSQSPVLIARRTPCASYDKVVAAVDDIASAETILAAACSLGPVRSLTAVHLDEGDAPGENAENELLLADPRAMYRESLSESLEKLAAAHVGMKAKIEISDAGTNATDFLARLWREMEPDLLVLGTRSRSPLLRFFSSGSAEAAILECPSDVLVVPTQSPM